MCIRDRLRESLVLCTDNDYTYLSIMALRNLAMVNFMQGHRAATQKAYHRALQIALEAQLGDLALLVVTEAAAIAAPQDPLQAIAWLTLVMHHPDASAETRRKAATQRGPLVTAAPSPAASAAQARGMALAVEDVLGALA